MNALRPVALAALVFVGLLALTDAVFVATFSPRERLCDNFSSAYLELELDRVRRAPQMTIFLGDSVLWGYKLQPEQTAIALLRRHGLRAVNLAYEGGSPVNTYAMLETLRSSGVRPARVVFNVNQKVFNAGDSAYAKIHPAVSPLLGRSLTPEDRALAILEPRPQTLESRLDRAVSRSWKLYALRTDIREEIFGDIDAAHALASALGRATGVREKFEAAHRPTPDAFEGTYDLGALDESNISVHFLKRAADVLAEEHVPAIAILTPTNHALLHEYIDTPAYRRNLSYVTRLLERRGVRVIDLDAAFGPNDFIDNDHLTAPANARFAALLARVLSPP